MNKPLAVALAIEARMRGVSRGQVLRDAGLETVVSTAEHAVPAVPCPTCGNTGWVTLNEADLTPQEGGPEPDERVCEDEYHDDDMAFLVWRLIEEYDEDMARPPSFVTIGKLRVLAAATSSADAGAGGLAGEDER